MSQNTKSQTPQDAAQRADQQSQTPNRTQQTEQQRNTQGKDAKPAREDQDAMQKGQGGRETDRNSTKH